MWTLATVIFCGCKWLTWRRRRVHGASPWLQAAYLFAWPGLDAVAFLRPRPQVARPTFATWIAGLSKLMIGMILLFLVARRVPVDFPYVAGWIGMVGLILILHFGAFDLLSSTWRRMGVDARPLMNAPLVATSLSEFWGKRWNTAFRDLTYRYLFRPLTTRMGATMAVLVGFVFSGVVHDVVISVPARGGYGGPTVFFILQGAGLLIERTRWGRQAGLGNGWRGWLFTMLMLLAPIGLLFHRPFVVSIIVPFLLAIGAL